MVHSTTCRQKLCDWRTWRSLSSIIMILWPYHLTSHISRQGVTFRGQSREHSSKCCNSVGRGRDRVAFFSWNLYTMDTEQVRKHKQLCSSNNNKKRDRRKRSEKKWIVVVFCNLLFYQIINRNEGSICPLLLFFFH